MFDIGWQELFLIAVVAIVVIGPKELPRTLRAIYGLVRKGRMMAREFQDGLDEMVRHADLDDIRKEFDRTKSELTAATSDVASGSREMLETLERESDEAKTLLDASETKSGATASPPPAALDAPTPAAADGSAAADEAKARVDADADAWRPSPSRAEG